VSVIPGVQYVHEAKLLGVILKDNLKTDFYVSFVLRTCDQRFNLLNQLRGLSSKLILFFSQLLSCALHMQHLPGVGLFSKEQEGKIDAFLRCSFCCGLTHHLFTCKQIAEKADYTFFTSITYPTHCLHQLSRPTHHMQHRDRVHSCTLPTCVLKKGKLN